MQNWNEFEFTEVEIHFFGVIRSLTNSKRDVTDRTMSISLDMSISHECLR